MELLADEPKARIPCLLPVDQISSLSSNRQERYLKPVVLDKVKMLIQWPDICQEMLRREETDWEIKITSYHTASGC